MGKTCLARTKPRPEHPMIWNTNCESGLCPTSVLDLTDALQCEWEQIPAAMFQHLVESLTRREQSGKMYAHGSEIMSVEFGCTHNPSCAVHFVHVK